MIVRYLNQSGTPQWVVRVRSMEGDVVELFKSPTEADAVIVQDEHNLTEAEAGKQTTEDLLALREDLMPFAQELWTAYYKQTPSATETAMLFSCDFIH